MQPQCMRFKERGSLPWQSKWTLFKTGRMVKIHTVCAEKDPTEEYRVVCGRVSGSLIKLEDKNTSENGIWVPR